jgi:hypothetical protein
VIKFNKDFFVGAAIGFGAGFALKSLRDDEDGAVRGVLKSTVHAALNGFDKVKEGAFTFKELMEDVTAEVKAERDPEAPKPNKKKARSKSEEVAVVAESDGSGPAGNT